MNAILDSLASQRSERNEMGLPERLLLLAVLEQATRDLLSEESRVREDALEWFADSDSSVRKQPFSFKWICEQLGLEVKSVLRKLGVDQELKSRQEKDQQLVGPGFDLVSWESWSGGWI